MLTKFVMKVDTIDDAEAICRKMNIGAFNSVGITDFKLINELIQQRQCKYWWVANHIFDEVGGIIDTEGYSIYERMPI